MINVEVAAMAGAKQAELGDELYKTMNTILQLFQQNMLFCLFVFVFIVHTKRHWVAH